MGHALVRRAVDGVRRCRRPWAFALLSWVAWLGSSVAAAAPPATREGTSSQAALGESPPTPPTRAGSPAEIGPDTGPRVEAVALRLTVWRAGDRTPDGDRVRAGTARVDGEARYRLDRPAVGDETLVLLNFAEALSEEPRDLDEIVLATYMAGPFSRGSLELIEIVGDAGEPTSERVGERRDLRVRLPEGTRELTVRYRVRVPHRYWPFGCVSGRCSLSGAVAPLPSEPARGGRGLSEGSRVITPTRWSIVSVGFGAVPSDPAGATPSPEQAKALGRDELVVTGSSPFSAAPIEYPSVFWGRGWHHLREIHRGVHVDVLAIGRRPSARVPDEVAGQLRRDDAGHLMRTAKEVVELSAHLGLELPAGGQMTLVQGPLRSGISEFHPTAVIVSDQFFEIFPVERVTKFHDDQVARALFDHVSHAAFAGTFDPSTGLWAPGTISMAMTRAWQRMRAHRDEYARDILGSFTFVPSVDRLLYSGQVTFASAYFRGSEDLFPLRNHPLWFAHELPTGRRIHEKLSDLMDADKMEAFYTALVAARRVSADAGEPPASHGPTPAPEDLAARAYGYDLGWFFEQWLGRYPAVDYAIEEVKSRRTATGWRTHIVIARDAEVGLVEPVQVLAVERGGKSHHLVWNGDTGAKTLAEQPAVARHEWDLETQTRVEVVRLDPRDRLLEVPRHADEPRRGGDNVDPLFNNRDPHKFRFLYTGIGLSIAASELRRATTPVSRLNAFSGLAIFEASLQRDLRRSGVLLVYKDRETYWAGGGSVNFHFLDKVNRQRRRLRLSTGFGVGQINAEALDPRGGMRLTENLLVSDDTRRFFLWPERGHRLSLNLRASQTLRLEHDRSDDRQQLDLEGEWTQLWRLAYGHVLASHLAATMVFPIDSELEFRGLARGGGLSGIRGFGADELFGRAVAQAQLEYRHLLYGDLRINAFHGAWVRNIGGVLFGGVTSVSNCEDFGNWLAADSWYGQVGWGLTSGVQLFGVTPQFIRVDAAVPIGRRSARMCLGESFPGYLAERQGLDPGDAERLLPRFNVNVTFTQPF